MHPPWSAVDSVFGPVYVCRRCEQPLTRSFDADRPSERECPGCGATLYFGEEEPPYSGLTWIGKA